MSVLVSASALRRRVVAAVVTATAVVGAVALPASAADRAHAHSGRAERSQIVISGAQTHTSDRYDRSNAALNQEWVEVANDGPRAVDLDGWTLSDEDGHSYTFRHHRLRDHQSVRVHTGFGRDRKNDLYQDRRESVWDPGHDTATLRDDHGRLVDSASWGHDHRDRHDHRGHRGGGRHDRQH